MKTIGYIRVSTDEQAKEGVSLEAQEEKIKAYCSLHGLELAEIIQDSCKSGKTLKREGIQRLIQLCESHESNHVVCYKLDRITRRTKDLLFLIEDVFLKNNVEFHSITERVDTTSPQGKFFLTLMGGLAQMERDLISERTKDALAFKKSRGERLGPPSLGFCLKDGELTQDPQESDAVAYAWRLRNEGLTLREIATHLTEAGFKPRRGSSWSLGTLHYLFARTIKISMGTNGG